MSNFRAAGTLRIAVLGIIALAAAVVSARAQETVSISVPLAVSFPVTDVSRGVYTAERYKHSGVERVVEQPWGEWGHRMERNAEPLLFCARVPERPR
jgi:hypothetical protein